jgi:(1->4)-alpha-D-glucan 1-alpha-D-glucosylmutase
MLVTDIQALDALCTRCGITLDYYDIGGGHHLPSIDVKLALLAALQCPVTNNADIQLQFERLDNLQWQTVVPPIIVHRLSHRPISLSLQLSSAQIRQPVHWVLNEELGQRQQDSWSINEQSSVAEFNNGEIRLMRFEVTLPSITELGYHRLELSLGDGSKAQCMLIVAPESCYLPTKVEDGKKVWGVSVQLYSLRSKRNWGIGDFSDLKAVVETLAPQGIQILGINPLHTLFSHLPENASPYSPSSRDFLNPIYLDIESIEEFEQSNELQQQIKDKTFQIRLTQLRVSELVDYSAVWALKLATLKALYETFTRSDPIRNSSRTTEFRQFKKTGGMALFKLALFEALQTYLHQQDSSMKRWQQWPAAYQDPESDTVKQWAEAHRDEIEFHQYLQWNCDQQLANVQQSCISSGMGIGLYRDLAVGNEKSSSQCWSDRSSYVLAMSVGAPADDFNLKGQDWGLPPLDPKALMNSAYQPFIQTLRANMRYAGALRIDHIMGLMRLFWVPPQRSPGEATYVAYPFDDLLGIVALESSRNQCLVIGEDLGTVPNEVRHALDINRILSYRILYFEKDWQQGTLKVPGDYPSYALCTSGSHDLPTLGGFWQEFDLDLRKKLDLYPSPESHEQQRNNRRQDRYEILAALARENLTTTEEANQANSGQPLDQQQAIAIQRFLARSNAMLQMIQLEDLLGESTQMNVPGTVDEYPNWRVKLSTDLEDWKSEPAIAAFAAVINQERST